MDFLLPGLWYIYIQHVVGNGISEIWTVCIEAAKKFPRGDVIWWHSSWIDIAPYGWFKNPLYKMEEYNLH